MIKKLASNSNSKNCVFPSWKLKNVEWKMERPVEKWYLNQFSTRFSDFFTNEKSLERAFLNNRVPKKTENTKFQNTSQILKLFLLNFLNFLNFLFTLKQNHKLFSNPSTTCRFLPFLLKHISFLDVFVYSIFLTIDS